MSLSFERVNFLYPGARAGIFDATLSIERGELVAVIGASGSGKTTLLRLLAGFLKPDSGRVLIDGRDVGAEPPEARHLGVVFQSYALFPHMRLWENVAYPLRVRGVAREERERRALDMLRRVGMGGRENDLPASLSGGQQQRVALARALVFEPRGLLLDEPLSALDASLRMEMRDEILRVQRGAGVAALLVTHDQEEALSIADKVVVMSKGRLAQIGAPRDLYEAPATAEIAAFVGQSNLWPGVVVAPGLIEAPIGRLACVTKGRAVGEAVIALARPERLAPTDDTGGSNVFCGESVADRYLGPVRRVDLKVARGVVRLETHLRGAVRCVRIPPESIRLLDADPRLFPPE